MSLVHALLPARTSNTPQRTPHSAAMRAMVAMEAIPPGTGGDYTDNTCYPYSLKPCAHHVPGSSKYEPCLSSEYPSPRCKKSCIEPAYGKSFSADKVRASSSYSVRDETKIMAELVNNGPMYVSFTVYGDFPTYKSGIYHRISGSVLGGHAVTLVGYGELHGEKYWKIKNSWNEQWGDNGHFLIRRVRYRKWCQHWRGLWIHCGVRQAAKSSVT